jgi:hypothetical protein
MRAIARFAGCGVTGLNNNAYQVERATAHNQRAGLALGLLRVTGDALTNAVQDRISIRGQRLPPSPPIRNQWLGHLHDIRREGFVASTGGSSRNMVLSFCCGSGRRSSAAAFWWSPIPKLRVKP